MTFSEGIHSLLKGTTLNLTQQSSLITRESPQSPSTTSVPQNLPIISFPSVIQPPITPPVQVQTTIMSTQPITAQATVTTPIDDKSSLRGKQPPVFNGTRLKADNFWRAFKIYHILNKDTNTIKSPFNRTALAISFIAGPNVDDWAEHQLNQLKEKTSLTNPNCYAETDEQLWMEFETAFQAAYQDTTQA